VNIFALEIWEDTFSLVTYYTVRWDSDELSETDKFINQYQNDKYRFEHFTEVFLLLEEMGERKGAKKEYFRRHADEASELPPKYPMEIEGEEIRFNENEFRLFCTRINENIVILFNGGVKSSQATQDSPDLASKFRESKNFAKKIWAEIHDEMLIIDEARHRLINENGSEEELLIH
jgi:hypothetical protein